jgi:hypothetical protein
MKLMNLMSVSSVALLMSVGIAPAAETPETPKEIRRIQSTLPPSVRPTSPANPATGPAANQPQLSPSEQLQRDVTLFLQGNQFDLAEARVKQSLLRDPNDPVALSLLKRVQDVRNEVMGRALRQKMDGMVLEEVHFTGAPVSAVVEYLQDETKRFSENGAAVNIVLNVPQGIENSPVNLRLRNVPILEVLRYVCEATRLNFRVDQHAIVISPATDVIPVAPPR